MNTTATGDLASILLVEDEAIIALAQTNELERAGYQVHGVHTGASAVAAVETDPGIDVVLMDIDLGAGMDGPTAARRILEIRELPIVFLTSHAEQSFVDRVEAITKYGYVLKSSGTFTLLQSIKTALHLFASRRKLQKSEARFRTLFENTPTISIQGYAPDGTVKFWNRASEVLYGYSPEEALGGNLLDLIIPTTMQAEVAELIRQSVATGEPIPSSELQLKRKDGSTAEVYSSHALLRYPDGTSEVFCLDVDISERKEMERALRRQEQEYRSLINLQSELLVRVDADGLFEFVSDSYCATFGKTREELVGHSFMPLVHEDDREPTRRAMEALYTPPHRCRLEQRVKTIDGWRWFEWDDTAVLDDQGGIVAILGAGRDITERKTIEEERRQILDSLPLPVVVSEGIEEKVVTANQAFTDLFGYTIIDSPDVQRWFEHAYPDPDYRRKVQYEWQNRMAEAEESGTAPQPMTVNVTTADGSIRTVVVRADLLGDKRLVTFTDLTEINAVQRRLEQSVAEKERLMLELNHRVKNNLNLVTSLIHMKQTEIGQGVDLSDLRGQINAISLVHQKLFSSGGTQSVQLDSYLADLLPSVFSFYPQSPVQVVTTGGDIQLPTATTVTLGVLVNELAMNAMKHGFDSTAPPKFTVSTTTTHGAAGDSPRLELAVSNNGRMFPEDLDIDNSPSLGLRLISALTQQLRGTLELKRTPQTTITISFPL